ncbi:Ger(x)C family spore germination protein [Bacillaceae bacterium SIJ1]|uniref:Ger(x)C family spore germination protein n=1 Tax=Litoribacterium kuwaitense TaxID=1398745 RepID=UPI0013EE3036|nr:Ger(x)C family spore germination protein [Litoribacterium kuwaitense]NGP44824.1 Ger(x)C family spore germination protein [Litoribacterium kuwaitense]
MLTGCWDAVEINDLSLVQGVGIDFVEDEKFPLQVTLGLMTPLSSAAESQSSSPFEVTTVKETGDSIATAIQKARINTGNELFWGNNDSLIISGAVAEKGILGIIDYFARFPEAVLRQKVFLTSKRAEDLLNISSSHGKKVPDLLQSFTRLEPGLASNLLELLGMINDVGETALIPYIDLFEANDKDIVLSFSGIGVLKKGALKAVIPQKQHDELLWLRGELNSSVVYIPNPQKEKEGFSLHVYSVESTLKPEIKNGQWIMTVEIINHAEFYQNETYLKTISYQEKETFQTMARNEMQKRFAELIQYAQQDIKLDIFQYAEEFYNHYPKEFKNVEDQWEDVFQNMDIRVEQKWIIERTGLMNETSFPPERGE